ncbi:hypothetical protein KGP26_29755 (plasmid) [Serratia sp. JSRIV002]|uniref:hypothetical protein n=1 Tax=Serratia sp. JSRIV002 TaxID=2831894 RepID=UPI001CBBBC72|nr:hypothetical protein [Serratia sp. JSRIV002]UAN54736.1 hypothetical protein KGP26_29755 [Serratia sp. JSRIV002]
MKKSPTPMEIRAARDSAKLTQSAAAALVHSAAGTWQQWEAGDRKMHLGFWELFLIKTKQLELFAIQAEGTP